jgi:hypothetical protein
MISSSGLRMLVSVMWFVVKLLALCQQCEQLIMCELYEQNGS